MLKYKKTVKYLYVGYIVQAVVNNLLPLFFVIFKTDYGLSSSELGSLILFNFMVQLCVDLAATKFGARLGYRASMLLAHTFATLGLVFITVLPLLLSDIFGALLIATFFFAVGGGLIEVMVSPMMDSIDFGGKSAAMSLLHSFYCWGQVLVVAVTTVIIAVFGDEYWLYLPIFWAIIPFLNIFPFIKAPLPPMLAEEKREPLRVLFKEPKFILMVIIMVCAGAFELAMSQWASYFAETGLGISKMLGDLLGPCLFAVFMGLSRVYYGIRGEKLNLERSMMLSSALGIICYLLAGLSLDPYISLIGCSVCGFAVGLMWPGMLSLAGKTFRGGTAMFGILALSGDLGCSLGPWVTGLCSDIAENSSVITDLGASFGLNSQQTAIKFGILIGAVFPVVALICLKTNGRKQK